MPVNAESYGASMEMGSSNSLHLASRSRAVQTAANASVSNTGVLRPDVSCRARTQGRFRTRHHGFRRLLVLGHRLRDESSLARDRALNAIGLYFKCPVVLSRNGS